MEFLLLSRGISAGDLQRRGLVHYRRQVGFESLIIAMQTALLGVISLYSSYTTIIKAYVLCQKFFLNCCQLQLQHWVEKLRHIHQV